jgi:dihydrodipicolinate synthase/N-acetylneuraminate lyase
MEVTMSGPTMRGIFPILVTPFDERERIDEESLRREVEFTIEAGVHGLGLALASEMLKLTEPEREQVIRVVVDQSGGRVPVVVNTGAQASALAVAYSRQAEALGAAAVMCLPPTPGYSAAEVRAYFAAVNDAVRVPVWIQDTPTTPVAAPLIRQIADQCERVRYAKVESAPQPQQVAAAVRQGGGLVTVFGGAGGQFLFEELRRGAVGTMPWPDVPGAFVRAWDLWHAGEVTEARTVFEREIAPLNRVAAGGLRAGHLVHKEVLRRRGIIASARVRAPADPLDEISQRELDEVCEHLGIGAH